MDITIFQGVYSLKLKHFALIVIGLSIIMLSACSKAETTDKENKPNQSEEEKRIEPEKPIIKVEYPVAKVKPEEIVQQHIGIKLEKAYSESEQTSDEGFDIDEVMAEFETTDLGSDEIFNGLVHWFGLDYTLVHDALANYEPDFGELDLTKQKKQKTKNITVHIDSSGSMAAHVPGGEKMALAKSAIKSFVAGLPKDALITLRAYGHLGSGKPEDKNLSCSNTEVMYETSTYDENGFTEALNKFKPTGWTPLASSIKAAYDDLKMNAGEETENILYIVSDGIETCDGNPVEEAKKLAESDLNVKIYIIGFNVDDAGQKQLKETANASNGKYFTVNSKVELENTLKKLMEEAMNNITRLNKNAMAGIEINYRTVDLRDQIREIKSAFMKVVNLENKALGKALSKLENQEKIEKIDADAVRFKLDERYEALKTYADAHLDNGMEKIDNKREELFKIMDES